MRDETKVHYSQVSTYVQCPRKYGYRYIDKIEMIQIPDANNPLICGLAVHLGAEKDIKSADEFYFNNFNIIDDKQINEFIKICLYLCIRFNFHYNKWAI